MQKELGKGSMKHSVSSLGSAKPGHVSLATILNGPVTAGVVYQVFAKGHLAYNNAFPFFLMWIRISQAPYS